MNKDLTLYKIVDMSNWCKSKPLLILLKNRGYDLNDRFLRKLIDYNNKLYNEHKREMYIAHSTRYGYIATTDKSIIRESLGDYKSRISDMSFKVRKTEKRLQEEGYEPLL